MRHRFPPLLIIVALSLLATTSPALANLINNGSFETPAVTSPLQYQTILPGSEPTGFSSGITSGNVDVTVRGAFGSFNNSFDGLQFLDLDGTVPGALAQSFATTRGNAYVLNFAYANNFGFGGTNPARATVSVFDTTSGANLIAQLSLTHSSSAVADLRWTPSGPIQFVAQGTTTTVSFRSNDAGGNGGIFLDAVSVDAVVRAAPPVFTAASIVSAASLQSDLLLTPGQIVSIFGSDFSDPCTLGASGSGGCALAQGFPLPVQLGATQVTFNGIAASLLVVTEHQINLVVPSELTGDTAVVVVQRGQSSSLGVRIGLSQQAIGVFSIFSTGAGAGVVLHADGRVVSRSAPIVPGEVVVIYGTGMGAVAPAVATSTPAPAEPLSWTTIPMRVFFDGGEGRILFSGLTPGFSGLYQMNVEVPSFLARNYPLLTVQSETSTSNQTSAGGPSLLDVTPSEVRLGLNSTVAVRGLNFPPNARLQVSGTDLAGARDLAEGLERFTVSIPASLLRPGRVPIMLVDANQPSEAPSNALSLLVVP